MSKICRGRDELLLRYAHGQLGLWQRIQVQWHVRRCPACGSRLAKYSMLSSTLAVAMASGTGPRWLPSSAGVKWGTPRNLLLGGVIAILTVGLWSLRNSAEASVRTKAGGPVRVAPAAAVPGPGETCPPPSNAGLGLSPDQSSHVNSCEPENVEDATQPSGSK